MFGQRGCTALARRSLVASVVLGMLGGCVLLAACGASSSAPMPTAPSSSATLSPLATTSTTAAPAPTSSPPPLESPGPPATSEAKRTKIAKVVAAGGVNQWLDCQGTGPTTYVIIAGLHSSSSDWTQVLPALRKQTRTCVYDRPGLGKSPGRSSGPYTVDAGIHARELAALLKAANEAGPFIPMGHSYGGLVARAFASQQSVNVVGLFLPEGVAPGYYAEGTSWAEGGTSVDLVASSAASENLNLGAKPLVVMTATVSDQDYLNGPKNGTNVAIWRRDQADALKLSTNSIQVTAHSAHVLQQDNGPAVIQATQVLLTSVITGTELNCKANWQAVSAECRLGR